MAIQGRSRSGNDMTHTTHNLKIKELVGIVKGHSWLIRRKKSTQLLEISVCCSCVLDPYAIVVRRRRRWWRVATDLLADTAPAVVVLFEEVEEEVREAGVAVERGGRLRLEHCRQVQLALQDTPACINRETEAEGARTQKTRVKEESGEACIARST